MTNKIAFRNSRTIPGLIGRASPYVHLRQPKTLYLNPNLTLDPQPDPKPNHKPYPNPNTYCLTVNLTLNVTVKSDPNTRPIP